MVEAVDEAAESVADGGEYDEADEPEGDAGDDGDEPEYEAEEHADDGGQDEEYFEPEWMGAFEGVDEFVLWRGEVGLLRVRHWGSFAPRCDCWPGKAYMVWAGRGNGDRMKRWGVSLCRANIVRRPVGAPLVRNGGILIPAQVLSV